MNKHQSGVISTEGLQINPKEDQKALSISPDSINVESVGMLHQPEEIKPEVNIKEEIRRLIRKYYSHYRKMPTINWLKEKTGITTYQVGLVLRELTAEGFLKKNISRYHMSPNYVAPANPSMESLPKTVKEQVKSAGNFFHRIPLSLLILKIVFTFVGAGAAYLSFYHTKIWFEGLYQPIYASIASGSMVFFSVAGIDAVLLLFRYRYPLVGFVFATCSLVVVLFSMFSTVAGQYTFFCDKIDSQANSTRQEENILWVYDRYSADLERIREEMERVEMELNSFAQQLASLSPKDFATSEEYESVYWTTNYGRRKAAESLEELRGQEKEIQQRVDELLFENPNADFSGSGQRNLPPDLYVWIASSFRGIDRTEPIQFWSFAFPAIFYDVMAPLSFFFAFFINGSKPKRRKRNGTK
ncbi:MAG: hypothetical protein PVG39_01200 [Desulfobacteraceae bacterium]